MTLLKDLREARIERQKQRREREELEDRALSEGQLWTVQIAYYRGFAIAEIQQGRVPSARNFQEKHQSAPMFLEPNVVLGSKLNARQQVCKLANVDDIRIAVVDARDAPDPGRAPQ